jgi:hypothetical protein
MGQPARTSTRQPLISRAMKAALMAEPGRIGNDEPRHGFIRPTCFMALGLLPQAEKRCQLQPHGTAFFADFGRVDPLCGFLRSLLEL